MVFNVIPWRTSLSVVGDGSGDHIPTYYIEVICACTEEIKEQINEMIIGINPGEATTMQGLHSGELTSKEYLLMSRPGGILKQK